MTLRQDFPAATASKLLSEKDLGEETWWRRLQETGTPLVEYVDEGRVSVHFFWRDPQGDEQNSVIKRVYVHVNGVTNHHSPTPTSLKRISNSNVWHWSTVIDDRWRGSYSLIPITAEHLPPVFSSDAETARLQQRAWWISLMPLAVADPLNHQQPFLNSRRHPLSAARMPKAPWIAAWQGWDRGEATPPDALLQLTWQSEILNNQRRVWLWTSGHTSRPDQRPLAILLDGQNWVEGQPIFSALAAETEAGHLPAACWLFIDAINGQHREAELPCNPQFWQAIEQELMPLIRQHQAFSEDGDRTLVAGQSYGGLAALYAGLHRPARFGRILSQSGSFWWPNLQFIHAFDRREQHPPGLLFQQLQAGNLPAGQLHIFQEVGNRERNIEFVNQQIAPELRAAGHHLQFRVYSGGHDARCWRDGLIEGCRWLLADFLPPSVVSDALLTSTGIDHD